MQREKYYNCIYRVLVRIWGQEPTITDRLLLMNYSGSILAKTMSIRKRIVMFIISLHLRNIKRNTKD